MWGANDTPYLIDWESAGYVQPAIEAVGTALDWSGLVAGACDEGSFVAFLHAYRAVAPLSESEYRFGLQAYCGNWCGWLRFNIQRSIGVAMDNPEEQALGIREAESTLEMLRYAGKVLPRLAVIR